MQENYFQKYNIDDKKPAKVICLGICILLDMIVLAGVITCLSTKKYIDLIIYAAIFLIATCIRISTLFFTFQIIISFKNNVVSIVKKYPVKEIELFKDKPSKFKAQICNLNNKENIEKCVRLCPKSCEDGVYMIELSKRKYLIYIDDYLFSLIEVNSDLS